MATSFDRWNDFTGPYSHTNLASIAGQTSKTTGLSVDDLYGGLDTYLQRHGQTENDVGWWGPEALEKALLQGYGYANPNSSYANYQPSAAQTQAELANQNRIGIEGTASQQEKDEGFLGMGDLGTLLMLAGGLYAGGSALGAFGGLGGGALSGSALAAETAALTGSGVAGGAGMYGGLGAAGFGMDPSSWGVNNLADNWDLFGAGNSAVDPFGGLGTGGTGGENSFIDNWDGLADPYNTYQNPSINPNYGSSGNWWKDLFKNSKSPLGKIFGGDAKAEDYLDIGGKLGATALGMYGSNKQANTLAELAAKSSAERAPFLNAATGWMNNPESYYAGAPAQAAMQAVLKGLSVNGNPMGSGTSLALATEAGLKNWQNAVTGFGNMGLSGQDSRNNLLVQSANADANTLNALGYGVNALTSSLGPLDGDDKQLLSKLGQLLLNSAGKSPV